MKSVGDVMSREPRTVGRNDRLAIADDLMNAERIRHLLVLDDAGKLTGVLSQRDLFHSALVRALGFGTAARDKVLDSILIKNVMTKDVETTTPDTPLDSAAALMAQRKIGCLPVVENDALVGILTEGDFVRLVADEGR
jgi:acetoin utilization protein AcuB